MPDADRGEAAGGFYPIVPPAATRSSPRRRFGRDEGSATLGLLRPRRVAGASFIRAIMPAITLAMLAMFLAMTLWSSSMVALKSIVDAAAIGEIVFLRLAVAAVALWLAVALTRQRFRLREIGLRPVLMGTIEPGVISLLLVAGMAHASPISAALIFGLMPVIQPVAGRLILGEPVQASVVAGASIAIAGTVLFVTGHSGGAHSLLGEGLIAAGMLLACLNQLIARRVAQIHGKPMVVSALQLTAAAVVGGVFLMAVERPESYFDGIDIEVGATIVYLGLFASAAAFFLYNFALRSLSVGRASLFPTLLAPLAAPLAAAYLGTPISVRDLAAMAIVVLGVLLPAFAGNARLASVFAGPR